MKKRSRFARTNIQSDRSVIGYERNVRLDPNMHLERAGAMPTLVGAFGIPVHYLAYGVAQLK